jgi:hypothetical protein
MATRDDIEFEEAGFLFQLFPLDGGQWWMSVTASDGDTRGEQIKDFEEVCTAVDDWIRRRGSADDPRRFKGLKAVVWNHETRSVEDCVYPTRGELLRVFDDGSLPTVDEFVEHMECCGDRALLVFDGAGTLLADRRRKVAKDLSLYFGAADVEDMLRGVGADIPLDAETAAFVVIVDRDSEYGRAEDTHEVMGVRFLADDAAGAKRACERALAGERIKGAVVGVFPEELLKLGGVILDVAVADAAEVFPAFHEAGDPSRAP